MKLNTPYNLVYDDDVMYTKLPRKKRTISELHSIYKRLKERSGIQSVKRIYLIQEIREKIPSKLKWGKDCWTVYYTHNDKIYKYDFTWDSIYVSWSFSTDILKFEGSKLEVRDSKIDFLLNNEIAFQLGDKYRELNQGNRYDLFVGEILFKEICELLSTKFQSVKFSEVPNVVPIRVNDETLVFNLSEKSNGIYKEFKYMGVLSEEIIF